jgi:hypothetical protein
MSIIQKCSMYQRQAKASFDHACWLRTNKPIGWEKAWAHAMNRANASYYLARFFMGVA